MSNLVIHIAETKDFSEKVYDKLSTAATVLNKNITQAEVKSSLESCDVFWFRLGYRISADCLSDATRCKIIVCPVTGLDHIDLEACKKRGIEVLSLKGEVEFLKSVRATAELTLALTLAMIRRIPQAVQSTRDGIWDRDQFKGSEISGKTVGIIGVGRLGSIVAGYFKIFGAQVIGFDKNQFDPTICNPTKSVHDLLQQCDIVTLHLSYQQDTHHFMNDQSFSSMKNGSLLINTSRGAIVDSDALVRALISGKIAGAALDVIENEFDVHASPLIDYARKHANLLITPHIGGNTVESFDKTELFMANKLIEKINALD